MATSLPLDLLIKEILIFKVELESRGISLPDTINETEFLTMTSSELSVLKRDLRDMVRSLGNSR